MCTPNETQISKNLARILRHTNEVEIQEDGYAKIDDLLKTNTMKRLGASLSKIKKIVDQNDKKRFTIKKVPEFKQHGVNFHHFIRCNQGHTITQIKDTKLLEPFDDKDDLTNCFHGTYLKHIFSINENGLDTQERNHIHFAKPDENGKITSGARKNTEIFYKVDPVAREKNKIQFFLSDNGVVLTRGVDGKVPPQCLEGPWLFPHENEQDKDYRKRLVATRRELMGGDVRTTMSKLVLSGGTDIEDVLLMYYRDDLSNLDNRVLACLAELFWDRWMNADDETTQLETQLKLLDIKLESHYVRKAPDFLKNQFLLHFP